MPSSPYQVSSPLPTLGDLQKEIDSLTQRLGTLKPGIWSILEKATLEKQLKAKQDLLGRLHNPQDTSGVPPAPDSPAIFSRPLDAPKIGLDDLKILLPE